LWNRRLMAEGWANHFDDEARAAMVGWAQPAAWEDTVSLGDMQMPAPMVATMLVSDLAIHGWDLAQATGQNYRCEEDVAEVTCRVYHRHGRAGPSDGGSTRPHGRSQTVHPLSLKLWP
jgi:uncharacterized protein (TIGR03086 family)